MAKILVVDDDAAIRKMWEAILSGTYKHVVLLASDGRDALRIIDKNPDIALVVSDCEMPNMDGFELAQELNRNRPDLKLVLTSGSVEPGITTRAIASGAWAFVPKPWQKGMLDLFFKF